MIFMAENNKRKKYIYVNKFPTSKLLAGPLTSERKLFGPNPFDSGSVTQL